MYTDLKYCPILHFELLNNIDVLNNQLESIGYQIEVTRERNYVNALTKTYYRIFTELMHEYAKLDQIVLYESL